MIQSSARMWLGGAVVLLAAVGLVAPLPFAGRVMSSIGDIVHAPLFAALAAMLAAFCGPRLSIARPLTFVMVWVFMCVVGVGIEWLQPLTGRQSSWQDAWADTWGALAGVVWVYSYQVDSHKRKVAYAISSCVLLVAVARPIYVLYDVAVQHWELPMLASFESSREMQRWTWYSADARRDTLHATHGGYSLRLELHADQYSGLILQDPVADWSPYDSLELDVWLGGDRPLDLVVKIEDQRHNMQHDDRFHHVAHLRPGHNRVTIRLADVEAAPRGRKLNLRRIRRLSLFTASLTSRRIVFVDNVILLNGKRSS